jgi:hypothetical protein
MMGRRPAGLSLAVPRGAWGKLSATRKNPPRGDVLKSLWKEKKHFFFCNKETKKLLFAGDRGNRRANPRS